MKETLERLWNEYLLGECSVMDTDEERKLTNKASELHEKVNASLNKEQQDTVEKYVDAVYDMEAHLTKKRFSRGANLRCHFFWRRSIQRNRGRCSVCGWGWQYLAYKFLFTQIKLVLFVGTGVLLRFGHARALTTIQVVIHSPYAASLPRLSA